MTKFFMLAFSVLMVLASPNCVRAHFLWVVTEPDADEARAIIFFGEDVSDRAYHLPERLAELTLTHRTSSGQNEVALEPVDTDDLVGLQSTGAIAPEGVLETASEYGIYHGTRLTYYAKHYLSDDANSWHRIERSPAMRLDVVPQIDTRQSRVLLDVTWDGKPLSNVSVSLQQGDQPAVKASTNSAGRAEFKLAGDAMASALVQFTDVEASGKLDGTPYDGAMYCMSNTFPVRGAVASTSDAKAGGTSSGIVVTPKIPFLPYALASFGAVVNDGWLYVYGGHVGREHEHSRDNLADKFVRVSLAEPTEWESLPMQTPSQGLALVAHNGQIYRIGGMTAHNAAGDVDELQSLTEFARFDPKTQQWTELPPLPDGRSSHDAVVVGDTIYVFGGWNLTGDDEGDWHDEGLKLQLNQPELKWIKLPDVPFQRRALALTTLDGHVLVIGGMNSDGEIVRNVDAFDPSSGKWRSIEPLPGEGMNGFGAAAWNLHGVVYAGGSDGTLYRLRSLDDTWQPVAKFERPRFFHRLLPRDESTLLGIAGASMKSHLGDTEVFDVVR